MRGLTISILMCSVVAFGCSSEADDKKNNGSTNNGATSNNGQSTTAKNNTSTNNTTTTATNNVSTSGSNNATTSGSNNSTGATIPSVSAMCSEANLTDCFSNFDCQQEQVCKNISDNNVEVPCCIQGTRGTKVLGDDCTGDDDTTCDSGICIQGSSDKFYCSAPCEMNTDCPEFMKCVPALGVCAEGTRE